MLYKIIDLVTLYPSSSKQICINFELYMAGLSCTGCTFKRQTSSHCDILQLKLKYGSCIWIVKLYLNWNWKSIVF